MSEFLDMGGYGAYIWSVYGLAGFIMVALLLHSLQKWRQNEDELQMLMALNEQKEIKLKKTAASSARNESV